MADLMPTYCAWKAAVSRLGSTFHDILFFVPILSPCLVHLSPLRSLIIVKDSDLSLMVNLPRFEGN